VFRGLRQCALALLLACLIINATLVATAEFESRNEVRVGNTILNNEIIIVPYQITLFHNQAAAHTDAESLAISPLPMKGSDGFSLDQTSDENTAATETGFFDVQVAPYIAPFDQLPGQVVGGNPSWVTGSGPISFAGIPANTQMTFPDMTMATRRINQSAPTINGTNKTPPTNATNQTIPENSSSNLTMPAANATNKTIPAMNRTNETPTTSKINQMLSTNGTNKTYNSPSSASYDYIIDANNSRPYLPGNLMLVKTVDNQTVVDRVPHKYLQLYATPEEIANRTIMERMWRNVHLNFNMDRAYTGETANPTWICPLKNPYTLMPWYPTTLTVADALSMTMPGTHDKRFMWPVGV